MKENISVVVASDAPLGPMKLRLLEGEDFQYFLCTEVQATDFGMLRLTLADASGWPAMNLYLHPHYVMWMLQGERTRQLGFL